jgi:alkylation response protein AidB-like acyl-CoA dehydrogenase
MSAHERVQQGGNLTLADYAKHCVVGERLINFRKYLQASKQHLTVTPMDYLLPFKDLVKQFEEKYERISLLYTQYPKTDAALFKEHASSDNAGPFTFMQALVFPGILLLGNEKQIEYWTKKVVDFRVTGSYAQTEITHGSDVQGLQTQAVYDKARKVFVFNTPNMAAIKFWPGGMGCVATHLVTQAQVMCEGKSFGLQTFVVEIRDTKNKMQLAKGVDAGDIGPKLGFKTIDNGYLRFENFEAP